MKVSQLCFNFIAVHCDIVTRSDLKLSLRVSSAAKVIFLGLELFFIGLAFKGIEKCCCCSPRKIKQVEKQGFINPEKVVQAFNDQSLVAFMTALITSSNVTLEFHEMYLPKVPNTREFLDQFYYAMLEHDSTADKAEAIRKTFKTKTDFFLNITVGTLKKRDILVGDLIKGITVETNDIQGYIPEIRHLCPQLDFDKCKLILDFDKLIPKGKRPVQQGKNPVPLTLNLENV